MTEPAGETPPSAAASPAAAAAAPAAAAAAAAAAAPAAAAPAAAAAATPSWLNEVLAMDPWETPGQHADRVEFVKSVFAAMEREKAVNESELKMLSGLFYSIRYLGCTYTSELEQMLFKYDNKLKEQILADRQKETQKNKQQQQQQQQQQQRG
ncbi:hypothetical protein, conserved [Eimeria brunetti]|uniref:XRN2-binding (XTBD) domain-containing protein n=1 Tax=Eimeria brunetti TaxID=51314 RepID=U6LR57_9EIME|nr:hypothetical protein, conserved [Eimeria brunetti]